MTTMDGVVAFPLSRIASQPLFFPSIANALLANESLMRSVNGLLLTTANLAEVVRGLPTRGLKAKTIGDSGARASHVVLRCLSNK